MKINLDITGMYYRTEVELPDEVAADPTVFDVMQAAAGVRAPNGGVMTFTTLDSHGNQSDFVNCITVEYDDASTPSSRQGKGPRVKGTYKFDDNLPTTSSQPGNEILFQLAWQYYISRGNVKLYQGPNGERTIIGLKNSNQGAAGIKLQAGDTVTWRLVAIFGLVQSAQEQMAGKGPKALVPMGNARELGEMLKSNYNSQ